MSKVAAFDRLTAEMKKLFEKVCDVCNSFFEVAEINDMSEVSELFKLYDMLLTQRSVLSAMICSAEALGTHGSALVDRLPQVNSEPRKTRTLTKGEYSNLESVSAMPNPELWFETLLAKSKKK